MPGACSYLLSHGMIKDSRAGFSNNFDASFCNVRVYVYVVFPSVLTLSRYKFTK